MLDLPPWESNMGAEGPSLSIGAAGELQHQFCVSQKPLVLMLKINLKVIMTIKECGIEPNLKSEHKQHWAQFKEKQMLLILHQAVQQAAPEQRIWVICTIWPPTRQVSYLLLHTTALPGAGSSTGTCQPCDLWPMWQEMLFTAWCHCRLCVFQLLCWRALSSPSTSKPASTQTREFYKALSCVL